MWYLYLVAVAAGIANAIEPGQNATLAKGLGNPMLAGLVCFSLSLAIFAASLFVRRGGWPEADAIKSVPWWAWAGGVLGAVIVLAQLTVSEPIGAAAFLACVVTAGVIGSVLLDHFGLVGFERHPAGRYRVVGSGLMILGVALVALF